MEIRKIEGKRQKKGFGSSPWGNKGEAAPGLSGAEGVGLKRLQFRGARREQAVAIIYSRWSIYNKEGVQIRWSRGAGMWVGGGAGKVIPTLQRQGPSVPRELSFRKSKGRATREEGAEAARGSGLATGSPRIAETMQ